MPRRQLALKAESRTPRPLHPDGVGEGRWAEAIGFVTLD